MQDNVVQAAIQPYIKLAQANMELLSKFALSPEVMSQSAANAHSLFQQAHGSATSLMQSNAFAHVMQGMLKNYTEFVMEISEGGMAALAQGQAAMVRQAQAVSDNVVDASEVRSRRARQAA